MPEQTFSEAGRVLSSANETRIRAAHEALSGVLDSLGTGDAAAPPAAVQAGESAEATELEGDFVPLSEAGVRKDGTALIKIIAPGRGSSGWYSPEVLKRDAGVFKKGLQIFIDHDTPTQEAERPEGSLARLAGELTSDAVWQDDGMHGPGLYSEAKFFAHHLDAVRALAPSIGMSIRAMGKTTQGKAPDGKTGPIVEQLIAAKSVDLVTVPGRGGKIVQMFEAARFAAAANESEAHEEASMEVQEQLKEAQAQIAALQADKAERDARDAAKDATIARMAEGLLLRDAGEMVREALAGVNVPDVTRARLQTQLSGNPPVKDGALDRPAMTVKITEAVTAEQAYLAQVTGYGSGRITGMGDSQAADAKQVDVNARMLEAFAELGLSADEAKVAAGRRGW